MLYFDTSFLTPLVLEELSSQAVSDFFKSVAARQKAISQWGLVELSSLLARRVRMKSLDIAAAHRVNATFDKMIADWFAVIQPNKVDF